MLELSGKRVLITGAADGIGRGAALAFAREGAHLALADIDFEKLKGVVEELRAVGAHCEPFSVDVSDSDSVDAMAAAVKSEFGGVDVLVNVAGVCVVADVADLTLDDWRWIMGINLFGPIHTIRAFLPSMRERRSGHIVNVSSLAGLVHFGLIGSYSASKAGLVALSAALDQEVYDEGIGVTAFCPGVTGTTIFDRMRFTGYSREKLLHVWRRLLDRAQSPERAGELIVLAVKRGKPLVVTTPLAKALAVLNRISPGFIRFVLRRGDRLNARLYR